MTSVQQRAELQRRIWQIANDVLARKCWSVLKTRMKREGAQPTTICSQLKTQAPDEKMRLTHVADTAQMLLIATDISHVRQPQGFNQSAEVAQEGAKTAKAAACNWKKALANPW